MKGKWKNLVVVALVLMLTAVGCASGVIPPRPTPKPTTPGFPVGTFTAGSWVWEFRADGTEIASDHGVLYEDGTYTVTGDQILVQDTKSIYCGDPKGVYRWAFDGKTLTFKVIDDPCAGRRAVVDGSQFSKNP